MPSGSPAQQHPAHHHRVHLMIAVLEPPTQYHHPYRGPVIERVLPLAQARALCRRYGAAADACAWTKGGKCYIVIPRNGPVKDLGSYRRHEVAHCNGWGGGHGWLVRTSLA